MSTYLLPFKNYTKKAITKIGKMGRKNYFFVLAGVGLITLLIFLLILLQPNKNNTRVTIGENIITAEISDSEKERAQGLSGRKSLPANHGMLFVFEEAKKYPFWMKDMKFPIDIIWINNGRVVDLVEHAKPEATDAKTLIIYKPGKSAKYVLEVNANYARENGVRVGDLVESTIFK